jgi:diguanylate cyclase (GGDEF)-like protein
MKKAILFIAIVLGNFPIARATTPPALTSVRAINALSTTRASRGLPVAIQATVTFFRGYQKSLFVQDGKAGIYVRAITTLKLVPGDRVMVKGITRASFGPDVVSSDITLLGHGVLPKPLRATFDGLIQNQFDSVLITTRGVVQSANLDPPSSDHPQGTTLRVLLDGGYVDAKVDSDDPRALDELLDSEVQITGVAGAKLDGKRQLTGIVLHVDGLSDIRILKPARVSPMALPITPMDQVLSVYHIVNLTRRVRVNGTVTFYQPGSVLVLQSGDRSIWIKTDSYLPIKLGDRADATGFPAVSNGTLMLYGSAIQDTGSQEPVKAQTASYQQLASSQHDFDLVSIEGKVAMKASETAQDEYVLVADGRSFSAIFPLGSGAGGAALMESVPIGAVVRVTGICAMDSASPFGHDVPFNILMRTPGDLTVLTEPSLITVRNLGMLVILLLVGMVMVGTRALWVGRKMRAHVANLGYIGNRRARILEDINNSQPLAGILESITELASATLKGACCWCQIADGAKLGNCPPQLESSGLRLVSHTIAAHTGPSLGTIYAAFDARTEPHADEARALSSAAELATLAIETRRLHSDLVHRSEFDLLTDVQNRFSFERHLDRLIGEARNSAGIFGVIYIDLDDFKSVNDLYGHQVGDLYLQQVTSRMKRQLRPGDMLARLGGDEFAVLVPAARNRADVEEVAERLESSFSEPFVVQGCVLTRSASVGIALYPEDAVSSDTLVTLADAAMYATKQQSQLRAGKG